MATTTSRRVVVAAALGSALAASAGVASGSPVVSAGVGAIRVGGRTPEAVSSTSVLVRGEAGWRLGPRTAGRLRLEGYRVDGLNLFAALAVDVELGARGGLSGFAGVSRAAASGPGSYLGGGGFVRWSLRADGLALRADGFAAAASRNDLRTWGLGLVVGVEWRP